MALVKHPRILYFAAVPNVGDTCNHDLVAALSGYTPCLAADQTRPHLMGAGSILSVANALSEVWGTGLSAPLSNGGEINPRQVHAVRGKLTHSELRRGRVMVDDVPLGDPGFLTPSLFGLQRSSKPLYKLGVIPHYVDRNHSAIHNLTIQAGVKVLDVSLSMRDFLAELAQCESIASTSLHGLIFAEAMEIPNVWIRVSDKILGGWFKYLDWFTNTLAPQLQPFEGRELLRAANLVNIARLHDCIIDKAALKDAFPNHRIEACSH